MHTDVCFLLTEHPFLDARIFKKEAKSLLKQGYRVTMIVPRIEGYLFDIDGSTFTERFLEKTFYYEGIKIVTYEQMFPEKNIKTLHYNLQSKKNNQFSDPLTQLGIEQDADIYHAHEFFSLYSGILIKRAFMSQGKRCKLVYDSHELEPDPLLKQPIQTLKIKIQMLKIMLKELDYLVTVSESIKEWYLSFNLNLPIEIIYNSPPLARDYVPKKTNNSELTLVYEGTVNKKRGSFDKFVHILELVNKQMPVKAKIIGGWKADKYDNNHYNLTNINDHIEFVGWQHYDSIPKAMKDADIGWIDLDVSHSLNNRFAMPNKFFSYLNNGVPVLVNQCKDMAEFIQTYRCGYVVPKLKADAQDYVEALLYLENYKLDEMSYHAREIMESMFSWEHMENRLFKVYKKLMDG
ncbi:glycosyltransferase [Virgibacillus salarius]|uniref:glycosyltransferase n=1 Tax=Virgibacillus salarius TaxID=447199 RepID=UPI0024902803|nr:glycosyltransferase [Virgibacillus salarius]WBX80845.1 glycosyltransferase [Virgibacillus salarius]